MKPTVRLHFRSPLFSVGSCSDFPTTMGCLLSYHKPKLTLPVKLLIRDLATAVREVSALPFDLGSTHNMSILKCRFFGRDHFRASIKIVFNLCEEGREDKMTNAS